MYVCWEDRSRSRSVQLEHWIDGLDVRVHIVAERVFVTAVDSEATDYPHGASESWPPSRRPVPAFPVERVSDVQPLEETSGRGRAGQP